MVFKVLCLTLLACTLAQAAPKRDGSIFIFDFGEFLERTDDAVSKIYNENTKIFQDKITRIRDAVKEGVSATGTVIKADAELLATPLRYGKKVLENGVDITDINDIKSKTGEAFSEVIDENADILTDKFEKVGKAAEAGYDAAVKNVKANVELIKTPVRFISEVTKGKSPDDSADAENEELED